MMPPNVPPPMPINASSISDLLAIVSRILPPSFLDPIKNVGPGYELYEAAAAAMARVSQGVAVLDRAAFIGTATSAALTTALVQFTRPGVSFVGSISTTVLTVTDVYVGTLAVGETIDGAGVTGGTTIVSLGTGTGGLGTYNLSASMTVGSSRLSATAGAVTIAPGTVVTTSKTNRDFILLHPAYLTASGAGSLISAPVLVQAVAASFEFNNCLGPLETAAGELIAGDIDTIRTLITAPDYADPTIAVAQYATASGGAMADLDQIGNDQDMPRLPGESDAQYRARLKLLPDVVSPGAIDRYVAAFFQQFAAAGAAYALTFVIETWQLDYQTAYDVPNASNLPAGSPFIALGLNTCFFFDDTRGPTGTNIPNPSGYFGRWLSFDDYRGAFIVVVPLLPAIADSGMFYDDPSTSPVGTGQQIAPLFETALGYVGASFFDVPTNLGGSPVAPAGYFDGQDNGRNAVYAGLYAGLNQIKAGGVDVEIVLYNLS